MIALTASILPSIAAEDNAPKLSAIINAQLNEPVLNAGDNAELQVQVRNAEAPILDGYLVVDIVKRDSSNENVIAEITTRDIILNSNDSETYKVPFQIPAYAAPGDYRIDTYLKSGRSNIVGIPTLFAIPNKIMFKITNNGSYTDIRINRQQTTVCGVLEGSSSCYPRQLGPTVEPGSTVKANLGIINYGNPARLKAVLETYEWDDTLPGTRATRTERDIDAATGNTTIHVEFTAPDKPTAYSIRISLYSGQELLSMYRSRIVVKGASTRILSLIPASTELKPGQTAAVTYAGPADGETPTSGTATIKLVNDADKSVVAEKSRQFSFGKLAEDPTGAFADANSDTLLLEASQKNSLRDFTLTAAITSGGKTLDTYTVTSSSKARQRIAKAEIITSQNSTSSTNEAVFNYLNPIYVSVKAYDDSSAVIKGLTPLVYYTGTNQSVGPIIAEGAANLSLKQGKYNITATLEGRTLKKEITVTNETAMTQEAGKTSKLALAIGLTILIAMIIIILAVIFIKRAGQAKNGMV